MVDNPDHSQVCHFMEIFTDCHKFREKKNQTTEKVLEKARCFLLIGQYEQKGKFSRRHLFQATDIYS